MSLQYYPHEDLHVKPPVGSGVHAEGLEPGAGDYFAITVINLTLAMALVSFALNDGVIGTLVLLGLIAGFNVLALRGMTSSRRNPPAAAATGAAQPQSTSIISRRIAVPFFAQSTKAAAESATAARPAAQRSREGTDGGRPLRMVPIGTSAPAACGYARAIARRGAGRSRICQWSRAAITPSPTEIHHIAS